MDEINLHFTGDFHAITTANNLLAAMIDNHMYWGNALGIDQRRIVWRRALDMNDRALRETVVGLGGAGNGFPREEGFDITVASEMMAAFCLADDLADLEARLGRMIVGYTRDRQPVTAADLKAAGAMTALLKDALRPNLVQTLEGSPALVHGGPFANIAHGCNSVIATRAALKLGDYVVTEAGIRRRSRRREVLRHQVPRRRAEAGRRGHRRHRARAQDARRRRQGGARRGIAPGAEGGVPQSRAPPRQPAQVRRAGRGRDQPLRQRHRRRTRFREERGRGRVRRRGRRLRPLGAGRRGCEDLAHAVAALADSGTADFRPLYPDAMSLWDKTRTIAREIYGADDIAADDPRARSSMTSRPPAGAPAGLHRQDPVLVLRRSGPASARRADIADGARSAPARRRRLRRRADGRHPHHARPAADPRGGTDSRGRRRNRRPVLRPRPQRGVGASARISFSSFKSAKARAGSSRSSFPRCVWPRSHVARRG